ncbi:MAG: alpha/beta hydrolase [Atopobiaceae bacterium]|jgi:fermentation-respiration switch protein FrsA (DUF1100 family)|nr:alpha/beta hydrolase [Atopobiaceae bacterium]
MAKTYPAASELEFVGNDHRTFEIYPQIEMRKVRFRNRFGTEIVADLYLPEDFDDATDKCYPAIVASHPHGGVKEQSNGLYAQEMATYGYVALAIDLSFGGESGGSPRHASSPETYVEDIMSAVDWIGLQPFVDRERIGLIGICASGGFATAAASLDPRVKALATFSMYDMGKATREGLGHAIGRDARLAMLAQAAEQRWREAAGAQTAYQMAFPVTAEACAAIYDQLDPVSQEFFTYYCTERGRTPNCTGQITLNSTAALMAFFPFANIDLLAGRPQLYVMGADAHSREFTEDAFAAAPEPKELVVIPDCDHVDLYDNKERIPFAKAAEFFGKVLGA